MILRDPNHPCAILWSVGNEVPKGVDESESPIETQLSDQVHRLDPTRPVREAIRAPWDRQPRSVARNVFSFLDLGGYVKRSGADMYLPPADWSFQNNLMRHLE